MSRRISAEILLALLTIVWVLNLTLFHLFIRPYPGFLIASASGQVTENYQTMKLPNHV